MSKPMVYVWPVRAVPGCVGFDEAGMPLDPKGQVCEVWPAKTLSAALAASYKTDAHFVPYSLVNSEGKSVGAPRVNRAAWDQFHELGYWLRFQCIPLDFDDPVAHASGDPASDEWRAKWWGETLPPVEAIVGCAVIAYETKGGARAVVVLPEAIEGGAYLDIMAGLVAEAEDQGIVIDKLKEHQRCYRLPFVVRDGKKEKRRARLDGAGVMDYDAMGRLAMVGQARPMGGKDAVTLPERREMPARPPGANERPGEVFERVRAWSDVLSPHGWKFGGMNGSQESWYRPGKKPEGPPSALTNYMGRGKLWVFTTGDGALEAGRSYDKIGAYTRLSGLDFSAASRQARDELVAEGHMRGWEERPARAARPVRQDEPPTWASEAIPGDNREGVDDGSHQQAPAGQAGRDVVPMVDGELPAQVDGVVRALAKHPNIYSRTNALVMAGRGGDGLTQLQKVSKASARVIMEERAVFVQERRGKNGPVMHRCSVDDRLVDAVIGMPDRWSGVIREVRAVHRLPVLRMDGSLIGEGYDADTKLLVDFSGATYPEPKTTRGAAVKAVEWLEDLVCDFPWETELDRSTMVALLVTATMRRTFNLCPGFLIDSPSSGIGKGTLVNMTSVLMSGRMPANMNQPGGEDELRKSVFSFLRDGVDHLSIDNITLPFGGEAYDTMMTSEVYTQRVLGKSETESVPNRTLITITGRNVKFRGDGVGRTMRARMITMMERPDVGRTFKYPELVEYVREHRAELVAACLTIARAYLLAGRPNKCSPLREYTQWNAMVREPILWLGRGDVIASIEAQRVDSDEDVTAYLELAAAWYDVYGERPVSLAEAVEELVALKHGGGGGSMTEVDKAKRRRLTHAIVTACGVQIDAAAITKHLRRAVATNEGRVVAGLKFGPSPKRGLRGLQFQAVATGKKLDTSAGAATLAPTGAKEETWWG